MAVMYLYNLGHLSKEEAAKLLKCDIESLDHQHNESVKVARHYAELIQLKSEGGQS